MKDEQNLEIEKIQEELNNEVSKLKNQLLIYNFKEEKDIQILEEKFKYDIFNAIGDMFNVKNKK